MEDQKYVVFKREDLEKVAPQLFDDLEDDDVSRFVVKDAVVIRLQDIFSGPGLHAYANVVQTSIDMIRQLGTPLAQDAYLERLESLRDFFFSRASDADEVPHKKVPD